MASTGIGWGAQFGGEVTDYVIVIRTPGVRMACSLVCRLEPQLER